MTLISGQRAAQPHIEGPGTQVYRAYGVGLGSNIPLPLPSWAEDQHAEVAFTFLRAGPECPAPILSDPPLGDWRCRHGAIIAARYSHSAGTLLWTPAATCCIDAARRQVDVYPHPGCGERDLGNVLAYDVAVFVLHGLGYPSIHASAVVTEYGAAAFVGMSGQGKSTMASSFLRRGAPLLTDDALVLHLVDGTVLGAPGVPAMKLWDETAKESLGWTEELPRFGQLDKRLFAVDGRYRFAERPERIRAVYLLDRYNPAVAGQSDISIRRLAPQAAFFHLLTQTSFKPLLTPAEVARVMPIYGALITQAAPLVLSFPDGFDCQEATLSRIVDDLATG